MRLRVFVLLAGLLMPLMAAAADTPAAPDGWLTASPTHRWYRKAKELDGAMIVVLSPAAQRRAELALDKGVPVLAMDPADYAALCPDHPAPRGLTPYLVRAVALDSPQGFIRALRNKREIAMAYFGPMVKAPVLKKPVVLLLPKPPTKLYVTARLIP